MESVTYIKNLRISPKKLRFLLNDIKKYKPQEVLAILKYTPKKTARIFHKAIASAVNNAKNTLKVASDMLKFKALIVEEGTKQKRWKSGGRGTAKPIKRKLAHIKIILNTEVKEIPKIVEPKLEVKEKAVKHKVQSSNVKKNPKSKVQK